MTFKDILLVMLMILIFGMGWIFGKSALDHFPPILLAAIRFGVAAICFIPFIKIGSFLVQLESPILILLVAIFNKIFPSKIVIFGVVISVVGVIPVAGSSIVDSKYIPVLAVIFSMVIWGIGQSIINKGKSDMGIKLIGALSILAAPQLLLLSLLIEGNPYHIIYSASLFEWFQAIYLGLVMTALGIGIWYYLIGKYAAYIVSPFLLLVPVISVIGGVVFLNESLSIHMIYGGVIIILGVFISISPSLFKSLFKKILS